MHYSSYDSTTVFFPQNDIRRSNVLREVSLVRIPGFHLISLPPICHIKLSFRFSDRAAGSLVSLAQLKSPRIALLRKSMSPHSLVTLFPLQLPSPRHLQYFIAVVLIRLSQNSINPR